MSLPLTVERVLDEEHTILVTLHSEDVLIRPDGLQVTLDRAAALALAEELDVAAREPVPCAAPHCTSLADDDYCAAHVDAGAGTPSRWTP